MMKGIEMLIGLSVICLGSICIHLYRVLWWKPERIREKLRVQGIKGPKPSLLSGNVGEMKKIESSAVAVKNMDSNGLLNSYEPSLFPYLELWRNQYGPTFMFATGSVQHLFISEAEVVKEISQCKSWDLGKPLFLIEELGPIFGNGITRSNGHIWAHQRKIIAPEFFIDKVKGMVGLMVESALPLIKSWEERIESEGGVSDIVVDDYLRNFTADVISKACFGSSYSQGKQIFSLLRLLQGALSRKSLFSRIPLFRYVPTQNKREVWKLEKEIEKLILKLVNECKEEEEEEEEGESQKNVLQMILQGAYADQLDPDTANRFIVDNCKNIYVAGYETTATTATWALMLLALHPDWQSRARSEVLEICKGQLPDADMLQRMKMLTMVIQETLRLYPPSALVAREVFEDMKLGDINIPKGVSLWIPIPRLHRIPEIWGPDVNQFKPERFKHGIAGACKLPQAYIPFGLGPRTCLGQKFAMLELKIILSLILSNFSFSLSPNYNHSPAFRLVIQPRYGLNLLVKRVGPNQI